MYPNQTYTNDQQFLANQRFAANQVLSRNQLPAPNQFGKAQILESQMPRPMTVRIKDITTIEGHRSNRVQGIGLVSGLKGTGGRSPLTQQMTATMLQNQGILSSNIATNNLSAVTVTAEIPPFFKPGETFTATVACLDDASSLYGGVLLRTSLYATDGQVYALASGPLVIGGFSAEGAAGSIKKNHDVVGKVQAQMEVEICAGPAFPEDHLRLLLKNKDYSTAYRIATKINVFFPRSARANHSGSVDVKIPNSFINAKMDFLVMINNLEVEPDNKARIVINEKTGTIVVGKNVKLSSVLLARDNLIITTTESPVASQPGPLAQGDTVVLPRTQIEATEQGGRYNTLPSNSTIGDLAAALNSLGVTPQDLISVLRDIDREGSLHAELIVE
jgi:flagellar P-ring protein precursor FlgI